MKKLGIEQQVVISDGWGYGKEHPGDDGKWSKWEEFVVRMVQEAQKRGLKPQWDIWNEPDHHFFWKRSPEQFNETWRRAYLKIRQTDPQAVIIGPSWSNVHPGQPRFTAFIRFCKDNKVVPDYVCWHFPRDVLKEAEECRKLLKAESIPVKGLMVNEYCTPNEQFTGKTAWLIAQIERAKIDFSCHAIWSDEGKGNLDGILFDARQAIPKGQWWAYKRYAALSGRLVSTTPSAKIDLVASRDEQGKIAHVLLGNKGGLQGDVTVSFHGFDKAAYLREGDGIHVVVERIPEDKGGAVAAVQTVINARLPLRANSLDVTIPWTSDRDAFAVQLGSGNFRTTGESSSVGQTRIARWKDDKTAAFLLMFDDSWPSHWQVAAPELARRGMTATFYVCPGKGEYQKFAAKWEHDLWKQGMVYGVHTMTHQGVKDYANADWEIGECARTLRKILPSSGPRLLSYAQPGVGPGQWNITSQEQEELLKKHDLINRPDFKGHGAVYHWKTTAEMLALADKAIREKGIEYLVIHGVERIEPNWGYQDFWALKQDIFLPLLDGLKQRSDRNDLWITDHISAHQYQAERECAEVRVIEAGDRSVRLDLKCSVDPKFYDFPLTLITRVPRPWTSCRVVQKDRTATISAVDAMIHFQAMPNGGVIVIQPATPQ